MTLSSRMAPANVSDQTVLTGERLRAIYARVRIFLNVFFRMLVDVVLAGEHFSANLAVERKYDCTTWPRRLLNVVAGKRFPARWLVPVAVL